MGMKSTREAETNGPNAEQSFQRDWKTSSVLNSSSKSLEGLCMILDRKRRSFAVLIANVSHRNSSHTTDRQPNQPLPHSHYDGFCYSWWQAQFDFNPSCWSNLKHVGSSVAKCRF